MSCSGALESSALVEQSDYVDELDDRLQFPEIFPCTLLSRALQERALRQDHDFAGIIQTLIQQRR